MTAPLVYTVDCSWGQQRSPDAAVRPTKWHRSRVADRGLAFCGDIILNVEDATPADDPLVDHLCRRCFPESAS